MDVRLTFEEIFDLEVAEHKVNRWLIGESYDYKKELIVQRKKLEELENIVENSNKLSIDLQLKDEFWDIDYSYSDKPINYYDDIK